MAPAIGAMVWQRRARLAKLKLEGLARAQLWRTILLESLLLLGSGCTAGACSASTVSTLPTARSRRRLTSPWLTRLLAQPAARAREPRPGDCRRARGARAPRVSGDRCAGRRCAAGVSGRALARLRPTRTECDQPGNKPLGAAPIASDVHTKGGESNRDGHERHHSAEQRLRSCRSQVFRIARGAHLGDRRARPRSWQIERYDDIVLRSAIARSPLKRLKHGVPLAWVLLAGEVTLSAAKQASRLDGAQRRRLIALARKSGGRPSSLNEHERKELSILLADLQPRLFFGSTLKRMSPMPLPKRLLYGRRGSDARKAASRQP
jgi:hypothetical protein